MVNLYQFLIFVEQWKLSYPINASLFLGSLKNLVLMEFLPTQYVSNWLTDVFGLADKCDSEECSQVETQGRRL